MHNVLLGRNCQSYAAPKFVRYASSILLTFTRQSGDQNGKLYTPYMTIIYSDMVDKQYNPVRLLGTPLEHSTRLHLHLLHSPIPNRICN